MAKRPGLWVGPLALAMIVLTGPGLQADTAKGGEEPALTIFITGCTLGSLRPCGCAGGQLGGLERLPSVFGQVPPGRRFLVDTGWWARGRQQQDLLKVQTLLRGFELLGYDLLHLTGQDLEMALSLGILPGQQPGPHAIGIDATGQLGLQRWFDRVFQTTLGEVFLHAEAVHGQDLHAKVQPGGIVPIGQLRLDVYLVDGPAQWPQASLTDDRLVCIVLPADSDQPRLLTDPLANPTVVSVGRFGRYVARLDLVKGPELWPRLAFSAVPVSEGLASHPELMDLYRQYQRMVADSGLLASYRRVPLPRGARYVGSQACQRCHRYEYDTASIQPHALAYKTLEKVGSHLDPECVVCHVVGLGYEGGFTSLDQTPDLAGVGCEVCHGPGWQHVRTGGRARTTGPRLSCLDCHSPEHSPEYADHTSEYLEKIHHWREPSAPIIVKPH